MRALVCLVICLFAAPAWSAGSTIEITARKSQYAPEVIRVKKGEAVTFIVTAADVTHGFAIDEFEIAEEVVPGRPAKVTITPDRAGEFYYYCVVRCGKKHKLMRGKLIVE